jgi:hypothetical protein
MNGRIPRHFTPQLREKLSKGHTMEEALTELRKEGASIFECIIAIKEHTGCDLAEAKRRIHDSHAWLDVIEATDRMWDELLDEQEE